MGRAVLKVLDFGIAKMDEGAGSVHVTATGMIMGTPAYMAPEQMRSSKMVDARADIWALGVIAYELLTGRLPFEGESFGDILFAVAEKPPPPPHTLCPGLDPDLSALVMKCLQRDPDKRFATVTELSDALEPFATASRAGTAAALRLSISGELPTISLPDLENAKTEQLHGASVNPRTVSEWVTEGKLRPRSNTRLVGGVGALVVVGLAVVVASRLHAPSPASGNAGATSSALASASGAVPVMGSSAIRRRGERRLSRARSRDGRRGSDAERRHRLRGAQQLAGAGAAAPGKVDGRTSSCPRRRHRHQRHSQAGSARHGLGRGSRGARRQTLTPAPRASHVRDDVVPERAALDLGGAVHQGGRSRR